MNRLPAAQTSGAGVLIAALDSACGQAALTLVPDYGGRRSIDGSDIELIEPRPGALSAP